MIRTFNSEQEFVAFAASFGRNLSPGAVVGLSGPLGAGKTTFVKAVVKERLGSDPVSSPTFTFWHRYPGIEHLDLYRIEDSAELADLGLEEAFRPQSITIVEWPEKAPELVGTPDWRVVIAGSGEGPRDVTISRRE